MNQTAKQYWNEAAKDPDVRYKYIADDWAKTKYFVDYIEKHNKDWNKVGEVGCGIGRLLAPLADNHKTCQFYGIDISEEMIKQAEQRKNITYGHLVKNMDCIYSMLVFQHMDTNTKKDALNFMYKHLKFNGTILIQFVKGNENAPYSYQLSIADMIGMIEDAGFYTKSMQEKFIHDSWCVIEATK